MPVPLTVVTLIHSLPLAALMDTVRVSQMIAKLTECSCYTLLRSVKIDEFRVKNDAILKKLISQNLEQ